MIREFEPRDMNAILKLVREHAAEAEVDHLPVDDIFFKDVVRNALIQDNSFVGLLTKLWNPTLYADVYFFYVHNSVRNKFLADSLHEATCSWAYQNGANWIEFSVALFDKEFKGRDDYVDRASTYFEHKGGVHCGNIFVQELG